MNLTEDNCALSFLKEWDKNRGLHVHPVGGHQSAAPWEAGHWCDKGTGLFGKNAMRVEEGVVAVGSAVCQRKWTLQRSVLMQNMQTASRACAEHVHQHNHSSVFINET